MERAYTLTGFAFLIFLLSLTISVWTEPEKNTLSVTSKYHCPIEKAYVVLETIEQCKALGMSSCIKYAHRSHCNLKSYNPEIIPSQRMLRKNIYRI